MIPIAGRIMIEISDCTSINTFWEFPYHQLFYCDSLVDGLEWSQDVFTILAISCNNVMLPYFICPQKGAAVPFKLAAVCRINYLSIPYNCRLIGAPILQRGREWWIGRSPYNASPQYYSALLLVLLHIQFTTKLIKVKFTQSAMANWWSSCLIYDSRKLWVIKFVYRNIIEKLGVFYQRNCKKRSTSWTYMQSKGDQSNYLHCTKLIKLFKMLKIERETESICPDGQPFSSHWWCFNLLIQFWSRPLIRKTLDGKRTV